MLPSDIPAEYFDLAMLEREKVRREGLRCFVKLAWHVLEPTKPLAWGWALDAMCDHLEAVTSGDITRLLMNVPPGCMKSLLTSVFWPAWEWTKDPSLRYIGTSHNEDYSTRDCRKMRDLVESEWYQARWGDLVTLTVRGVTSFENDRKGSRKGTPFASLTGGRGDRVIVDDPHSTEKAESDAERKTTLRIFRESLPTRVNDPEKSAIVVIMQRLHQGDVSGEILSKGLEYDHLMLPMRYEPSHPYLSNTSLRFKDPRNEPGELLFPERFPQHVVDRDEKTLGPHAVPGQYQQRPAPREGGIVKVECLSHRYKERGENPIHVVLSLDCASKASERNDPTAAGVFAEFEKRTELWHVGVGRRKFPELLMWTKDLVATWRPTAILIEDKDAGQQLIQVLKATTSFPIVACNPGGLDKATRMDAETAYMEAGNFFLPEDAEWLDPYVSEMTVFPAGANDDQVDMTSQALKWLREKRYRKSLVAAPLGGSKRSARRP